MTQQKHKKQNQIALKKPEQSTTDLTLLGHLYEIRKRLFWIALVLVVSSAFAFQFKDPLIDVVMAPLGGQQLVYLTPGGGFSFIFTLCLYFGALVTIPVMAYHIFRFLQPIMGEASRKFIAGFLITSTVLAIAGALFGYFVTIPAALTFLATFAGDAVIPNLTADSYLSFVVTYVLGLALVFQLPLLLFIVDHIRPLPPGRLLAMQRYVIITATILAAVITPTPDVYNMALVGMPIIAVYQFGAIAVFTRRHGRKRESPVANHKQDVVEKHDEPLAEIIEELNRQPAIEDKADLQPIPQLVAVPIPVPVPQPTGRVVDGFGVRSRPAPARPLVTERPTPQRAAVAPRPRPAGARRSIDGFSR